MLTDELDLDGRPNLNLASFVGTYMEDEARKLIIENLAKNMSDADEYPGERYPQGQPLLFAMAIADLLSTSYDGYARPLRQYSGPPLGCTEG